MPDEDQSDERLPESLARLAAIVLSEQTVEGILDLIVSLAAETIPRADGVGVTVVSNGRYHTASHSDEEVMNVDRIQYDAADGPCVEAFHRGEVVYAPFLADDHRWPNFTPRAAERGLGSILSMPLGVGGDTLGALNLYSRGRDSFAGSPQETAATFARYVAVVLANAISYDTTEVLNEQLREALKSRETIGQAKGILMAQESVGADEAFDMLVRLSQRSNVKLRDVAQQLVDSTQKKP
jgi:GAF domain-containing protein